MGSFPSIFKTSSAQEYDLIHQEYSEKVSNSSPSRLDDLELGEELPSKSLWLFVVPWVFSTFFFAFLSLYLHLEKKSPSLRSFETGWDTDFGISSKVHFSWRC